MGDRVRVRLPEAALFIDQPITGAFSSLFLELFSSTDPLYH